jgi:hypothetical protein
MGPTQQSNVRQSAVVLGNAAQLVVAIVKEIAGNNISDTLNGSRVTANTLRTLAQARFKNQLLAQQ